MTDAGIFELRKLRQLTRLSLGHSPLITQVRFMDMLHAKITTACSKAAGASISPGHIASDKS